MTKKAFLALQAEITREFRSLEKLKGEIEKLASSLSMAPSFMEIRAAGSILHDFYGGIEKIFQRIAARVDEDLPSGEDGYVQLLKLMSTALPEIRPAVISERMEERLSDYLRFRHLFRNIYGFELKWEKCEGLVNGLGPLLQDLKKELKKFMIFLDKI